MTNEENTMLTKPTDVIILLYPSNTQSAKNIRDSLGTFCTRCNLVIADIIALEDEYDHKSMKRFVETISHYLGPIALVTNRSIFGSIFPLTLWSILSIMDSTKITQSTRNFLNKVKDSVGKSCKTSTSDFYLLNCKETGFLADWITEVKYYMEQACKDSKSK